MPYWSLSLFWGGSFQIDLFKGVCLTALIYGENKEINTVEEVSFEKSNKLIVYDALSDISLSPLCYNVDNEYVPFSSQFCRFCVP